MKTVIRCQPKPSLAKKAIKFAVGLKQLWRSDGKRQDTIHATVSPAPGWRPGYEAFPLDPYPLLFQR